ncbi:TonB-dependent receptor domain-containing protein [Sphingopyxis sp.]|uniref:TonB-dependent receptor domain-containing protein n=1 Tax=Sphingopyxis sp. TaxID=1908224 RepID=UPI003D0FD2C9
MKKTSLLVRGSTLCVALFSAMPAIAQVDPIAADAETVEGAADSGTIVVTGSRIRRPNVESNLPVTSVSGEEFFQQGQNNIGDTLNDLPQLRSTFAQQNPGAGVGIAGLNLLDLRGLGTVRTLVLVNGRRHVAADILNNAASPDVNTIPNDLIERVDIVTGGNSAVYGSDAIAGVVNFILRRDFDGIQIRGTAGISEGGFGGNQYASIMAGHNFADGRGNITAHAEYAHQTRVYASDIPGFDRVDGFATVDVDSGGLPSASDGFPDATFFRDLRSAANHRFGLVAIPQQQGAGRCGAGTLANNGPTNTSGTSFHCNYIFNEAGRLVPQTGTRFGTGPGGTFVGGNGQTGREGTLLSILPYMERYNGNLLARFEVSKALELFAEAKLVRINAVGNALGPTFLNNTTGSLGNDSRIAPRLDNPFLNPADRATIANAITASNCGYALGTSLATVTCTVGTPAAQAARATAVANGSYRFLFARTFTDLVDRDEIFRRTTYRVVVGARGEFNDDWNYEISANYGKMKERTNMKGFVNRQRFLLSLDAGIDPLNPGAGIQCRSKFDAAARVGAPGYANSAATLAADIAACVPYNPFGAGDNRAAAGYFSLPIENNSSIDQLNLQGFVSGDLSQLFELPGGPIRFAIGTEYRREKAFNDSDEAADTGISNSVFLGDVLDAPALVVKEAYGEIQIPLLKDLPLAHELTITGAGRLSDYNTSTGTIYAYNAGIEWAPIEDIRFRANYGRAVRAPNITETGFPNVPNFANQFIDPCNANAIGLNPIRNTNCTAQLSAAQIANLPLAGYSLGIISGSNPNVTEETSDSYTAGVVIQPRFIPGLSITADYYKITVNNVIVSLPAQTIVNACYDSPNLSSPLCSAFARNFQGSPGPAGELPGQILFNSTVQGPNNFAKRVRRGVDVEVAYRTELSANTKLSTRLIYSHQLQNSNFENPSDPTFENRLLSELGDPKDEFRWNVDLNTGPFTFGYEMRYIGPMLTSTYENFYSLNGLAPLNSDAFDIRQFDAVFYHDVRMDVAVGTDKAVNFFVGVDNILGTQPPLGSTATGVGSAIYNIRGRNFYAGFKARF